MVKVEIDHPRVRASVECPVCSGYKAPGLIVCWPCFRNLNLRFGNPEVERIVDLSEAALTVMDNTRAIEPSLDA